MKIAAYSCLHYGSEYYAWAIRSIIADVDRYVVLYCPHASHGHATPLPLPKGEEKAKLLAIAEKEAGNKLRWVDVEAYGEGEHRNRILNHVAGYDVLINLDSDEVWPRGTLWHALNIARTSAVREHRIQMLTPWRGFKWFNTDPMMPGRIICLNNPQGFTYVPGQVWHLGYSIRPELMRYKLSCHGHKNELRDGWLERKYLKWPPEKDLHPTCNDMWNPTRLMTCIDELHDHPYRKLDGPVEDADYARLFAS